MPTTKNRIFWASFVTLFAVLLIALGIWWFFQVQEQHRQGFVEDPSLPLRTQPRPREWTEDKINEGLPYREEKGVVHVLAWEVIEDDRRSKFTQVLVLKKFHRSPEKRGRKWVLAQVYYNPREAWAWNCPLRIPPPYPADREMPKLTDAHLYGHEFYNEPPSDEQIKDFLKETDWTPDLGTQEAFFLSGKGTLTTTLTGGGVDRTAWKRLFGRDVPTELFPELKNATVAEK